MTRYKYRYTVKNRNKVVSVSYSNDLTCLRELLEGLEQIQMSDPQHEDIFEKRAGNRWKRIKQ